MQDILPGNLKNKLTIEVFDRRITDIQGDDRKQLYSSNGIQNIDSDTNQIQNIYTTTITLDVGGRKWDIRFNTLPGYFSGIEGSVPTLALYSGLLISFILFALILNLTSSNKKAQAIAKAMTEDLLENQERINIMAETVPVAIILLTTADRRIISMNKRAYDYFSKTQKEVINKEISCLFYDSTQLNKALDHVENNIESDQSEIEVEMSPDTFKWLQTSARITALNGSPITLLALSDVTERKQAEQKVRYMAHFDTLTGLINRNLLHERLTQAITLAHRYELRVGIIFLDMDRFKDINDTLGHSAGDELLKTFSERLKSCVRDTDIIARLGGDEFVIIIPEVQQNHSLALMTEKLLDVISQPCIISQHEIHPSSSAGIAVYPNDGDSAETLLANADTAMYFAKAQGRNKYQFFAAEMNAAVQQRVSLERDLRAAFIQNSFSLNYQPQIDAETALPNGVEALIRWQKSTGEYISPMDFIPVAEDSGLINQIGLWVLEEACRQGKKWHDQGLTNLRMAVNISAKQFQQDNFVDCVTNIIKQTGYNPALLEIEITETTLINHHDGMIDSLDQLHNLGITIAIDDFGTGYSSLSYLKRLPIDNLKIDRAFVRDIQSDSDDQAIITAVVAMAKTLGLKTVAEGVENTEQVEFLKKLECNEFQGYYYSRPLTSADAGKFLHQQFNTNIKSFPAQTPQQKKPG